MTEVKLSEEEATIRNIGFSLLEMTKTRGWEELKKHLEDLSYHSWVDPREAKDKEEYMYREVVGWAGAKLSVDLINWVDNRISQAQAIEDKAQGKEMDKFKAQFE